MNIVIATDSYKECMSGLEVATNIKIGMSSEIEAEYLTIGIADGGEGTTDSLIATTNGQTYHMTSLDALHRPIDSYFGLNLTTNTAFIEMAKSSGLELISELERNPLLTSSYGTGLMIKEAIEQGVSKLIIGIGGSATNDVGIGMLEALGVIFKDQADNPVIPNGQNLIKITTIDTTHMIDTSNLKIEVACDVTNPLYGQNGASFVYAKQKGATDEMVEQLEAGVKHFAKVLSEHFKPDPNTIIGGGAAGGMGVALKLFLNAELKPGFAIVSDLLNLEQQIKTADLIITGEGRLDQQSLNGKGPIGVAKLASNHQLPCIAICGAVDTNVDFSQYGITAAFSITNKAMLFEESIQTAEQNIQATSKNIAKLLKTTI